MSNDDEVFEPDEEGSFADDESTEEEDALLSRLRVIEDQPLESRASAFAQVHEQLRSRLDGQ